MVGFIGNHPMNKNGELLCNLIDKHTQVLLNGHPECEGEITWEQRGRKSVIDYILVNKNMHENFISMVIDEDRKFCDLSFKEVKDAERPLLGSIALNQHI